MAKDGEYNRLIHTTRWLRLRRDRLMRHPVCQRCEAEGRLAPSTEVHHVWPVEDGLGQGEKERLMFDPHNLQALCHECHIKAHTELGRSGKAHAKRRADRQLGEFVKKFLT